jgi:hypothetical protein
MNAIYADSFCWPLPAPLPPLWRFASKGNLPFLTSQSLMRRGPALYAAAAKPRLPNFVTRSRNNRAEAAIACRGSNGLSRPTDLAVSGMKHAIPCAPARLTTSGRNPLSWNRRRMKKGIGNAFDWADCTSVSQISRLERSTTGFATAAVGRDVPRRSWNLRQPRLPLERRCLSPRCVLRQCRRWRARKDKRTEANCACRPLEMRTHAQTRIVANIEFTRWDPLTVRALGAFESGRNSGMLVKKMWSGGFWRRSVSSRGRCKQSHVAKSQIAGNNFHNDASVSRGDRDP